MAKIGILFATRHGSTARIAQRMAQALVHDGHRVDVITCPPRGKPAFDPRWYDAVLIGSSMHMLRHHGEIVRFIHRHRASLASMPAGFFSVSLSAGSDDPAKRAEVRSLVDRFLGRVGWRPAHVALVAGTLAYTRYDPLTRFVMKQIARVNGAALDTSRDHEYTDWSAVEAFARAVAGRPTPHATEAALVTP